MECSDEDRIELTKSQFLLLPDQVEERVLRDDHTLGPSRNGCIKLACGAGTNGGHQNDSQDDSRDGGGEVINNCSAKRENGTIISHINVLI